MNTRRNLLILTLAAGLASAGPAWAKHDKSEGKQAAPGSELEALRDEIGKLEDKIAGLRAQETDMMVEQKKAEADKAKKDGNADLAARLEQEAADMREGAKVQEQIHGLRKQVREARRAGDQEKAESLAKQARELEGELHKKQIFRGISGHEERLEKMKRGLTVGLKHMDVEIQDAREQKDDKRAQEMQEHKDAAQQALKLVDELLADAKVIKAAGEKGQKEEMEKFLRQAEEKGKKLEELMGKVGGPGMRHGMGEGPEGRGGRHHGPDGPEGEPEKE